MINKKHVAFIINKGAEKKKNGFYGLLLRKLRPWHSGLNDVTKDTKVCYFYTGNRQMHQDIISRSHDGIKFYQGNIVTNKLLQYYIATQHNINTPYSTIVQPYSGDLVVKPYYGLAGHGIKSLNGIDQLTGAFLQEKILKNAEYRCMVTSWSDQVTITERVPKTPDEHDINNPIALNTKNELHSFDVDGTQMELVNRLIAFSKKIHNAFGLDYSSIDIVKDNDEKLWFIENNPCTGFMLSRIKNSIYQRSHTKYFEDFFRNLKVED